MTDDIYFILLTCGRRARLARPFTITVDGYKIKIPAGFETDFASVPRIFWRIIPPWGKYSKAAVIHDYLYSTQEVTRLRADKIFLSLMVELKVKKWKRRVMYRAVRMFGWHPWNKHKEKD